jgi:hypothetical protein
VDDGSTAVREAINEHTRALFVMRPHGPRCSSMIRLETVDAVPVIDSTSDSGREEQRSRSAATYDL